MMSVYKKKRGEKAKLVSAYIGRVSIWMRALQNVDYDGITSYYIHSKGVDPVTILALTWKFLSNHSIPDVFVDVVLPHHGLH